MSPEDRKKWLTRKLAELIEEMTREDDAVVLAVSIAVMTDIGYYGAVAYDMTLHHIAENRPVSRDEIVDRLKNVLSMAEVVDHPLKSLKSKGEVN